MSAPSVDELMRAVVLHPDDAAARYRLAEALFADGEFVRAAQQLERAVALDGADGNTRRLLARAYQRSGRSGDAQRALEALARATPGDPAPRDELAELLLGLGRVDDALVHVEEGARLAPHEAARHRRAAELYRRRQLWPQAHAALVRAQRAAPDDHGIAAELADAALQLGGARELDALGARLGEAAARLAAGDVAGAKRALVTADDDERASAAWSMLRGEVLAAEGDVAGAERAWAACRARGGDVEALRARWRARAPAPGRVGVLSWTATGGTVSPLEAAVVAGRGELVLSGNVGAASREAAQVAWSCLKQQAGALGITGRLAGSDLHLHLTDTDVGKDGPSLGLALFLAAASAFLDRPLLHGLAATGELTLHGEVKAVGGLHEKVVAARLAGLGCVLLPRRNLREVQALPPEVTARLALVLVDTTAEALAAALPRGPHDPGD